MPLRDHFRPPLANRKPWESVHNGWAFVIARRLNAGVLPRRYESTQLAHHGSAVEIDIAADHDEPVSTPGFAANGHGGVVATAQTYTPPATVVTGPVAFIDQDVFEIQVYKDDGGLKLVAAVELVSPSNKDRPSSRRTFATKVAAYLQQGVAVVTVDVVTDRTASLHDDLVQRLQLADGFAWQSPTGLSAVSYRVVRENGADRLDVWPFPLALGDPLPTVPLWLNPVLAVPLELEPTYEETCDSLLIR
ncbi:MAG TPA: DUF4058 family protein [Urbifossiella sp.]|jgi:hypothetical protein|nr:DUF4058 family protein [Urbifossiella sp.]